VNSRTPVPIKPPAEPSLYSDSAGAFSKDGAVHSILHLHRCCDTVPDVGVEEAIFGSPATLGHCLANCMRSASCGTDDIRLLVNAERQAIVVSGLCSRVRVPVDSLLAVRLYTFGGSPVVKFYAAVNNPFYESNRNLDSLRNQLPYVRNLIRALRYMGAACGFYHGVVYRGVDVKPGSYLSEVYNNYTAGNDRNNLIAGRILRFPIFTSTSVSQKVVEENIPGAVVYVIALKHDIGVDISQVSYFAVEQEVLLIPPASFIIRHVCMVATTLYIYLESEGTAFAYVR
jgi:hypothetical protein